MGKKFGLLLQLKKKLGCDKVGLGTDTGPVSHTANEMARRLPTGRVVGPREACKYWG